MNNNLKDRARRKDFGLTPKERGLVVNHIKEVAQSQLTPIKDILEQNINTYIEAVEAVKKATTKILKCPSCAMGLGYYFVDIDDKLTIYLPPDYLLIEGSPNEALPKDRQCSFCGELIDFEKAVSP